MVTADPPGPVKVSPTGGCADLDCPCLSGARLRDEFVRHMAYTSCMASKTERLSLRLTPEQDAVLRRAAEARGESTNDFVLRHAVEAAETELADRRVFVVDDAEWDQLQKLLSAPPALPVPMVKLLSNPSVLEQPA